MTEEHEEYDEDNGFGVLSQEELMQVQEEYRKAKLKEKDKKHLI